jgi:hypothetical protein
MIHVIIAAYLYPDDAAVQGQDVNDVEKINFHPALAITAPGKGVPHFCFPVFYSMLPEDRSGALKPGCHFL